MKYWISWIGVPGFEKYSFGGLISCINNYCHTCNSHALLKRNVLCKNFVYGKSSKFWRFPRFLSSVKSLAQHILGIPHRIDLGCVVSKSWDLADFSDIRLVVIGQVVPTHFLDKELLYNQNCSIDSVQSIDLTEVNVVRTRTLLRRIQCTRLCAHVVCRLGLSAWIQYTSFQYVYLSTYLSTSIYLSTCPPIYLYKISTSIYLLPAHLKKSPYIPQYIPIYLSIYDLSIYLSI